MARTDVELADLLDRAGTLVHVVELPSGRITRVNGAWRRALGYDAADLERTTLFELASPGDAARLREALGGSDDVVELRLDLVARDGQRVSVEGSAGIAREDGRPVSARAVLRDVSPRKRAEAERRTTEATYRTLARNLPRGAVLVFDRDLRFVVAEGEDLLATIGLSRQEIEGRLAGDVVLPANRALAESTFRDALEGRVRSAEYSRGGRTFELRTVPLRDDSGAVVGGLSLSYDITDHKRVEFELRESRARLLALIENAPDAIWSVDRELRLITFNSRFREDYKRGSGIDVHVGMRLIDRNPPEGHDRWSAIYARALEGERQSVEQIVEFGGEPRHLMFAVSPIVESGAVTGVVVSSRDITERVEVERLKNEFVSVVSHELRTPLTAIRGSLGLLGAGVVGELPEAASELAAIALSNTDRLVRLVNDILDLEKLDAGRMQLRTERVAAAELVSGAIAVLHGLGEASGVTIVPRVDEPPGPTLVADRDRLIQVLTNLLSNAVKFSPQGSAIELRVRRTDGARVRFDVRDHGPGIPRESIPRLFGRFQQLDASDQRPRGGTGLGLAISKAIVEQHGGAIGVESELGAGSTFWFEVPDGGPS